MAKGRGRRETGEGTGWEREREKGGLLRVPLVKRKDVQTTR